MPGLLTLKTDLKSLKYGHDTPGGGDSGQPYIKTDINTVDSGFNQFRLTRFDDGLVRGGIVGTLNAAVTDTLRIGKFLVDPPKGPLFSILMRPDSLSTMTDMSDTSDGKSELRSTVLTRISSNILRRAGEYVRVF